MSQDNNSNQITGAQAIIKTLECLGITDIFGLPGGAILPAFDPLYDSKLNHILVRHEQGAGHAAQGYALATGKVGCCIVTSGPGATNLVTPIADAMMDSVPMLCITGQVGAELIGTDAFQEADIVGITMPITKHSFLVTKPEDVPSVIAKAYHIATTGRPGPVLVDVTKTAQVGKLDFSWPVDTKINGYKIVDEPSQEAIDKAAMEMALAKRPVLYVGGGAVKAGAYDELKELADITGFPFSTTLTARGVLPDSHENNMGMTGMHGTVAAVGAMQKCDLLISLGARFDDRVTGSVKDFAPDAKVIHIDIDPAEISKIRFADVDVVADLKFALPKLVKAYEKAIKHYGKQDLSPWFEYLNRLRENYPLYYDKPEDGLLSPQQVIERVSELSPQNTIYVSGVGQHQMWSAQFIKHENPRSWISSCGLGTMGYGVPAGMGAKVACPEKTVWIIDGDGCFQMTNQELATCALNGIAIKVALINNSSLGMVRQWQRLFYNERFSNTDLFTGTGTAQIPDFVKLTEAYGCVGLRCEKEEDIDKVIEQALEINDRPVVIDFRVTRDAVVWPMVSAGVSNSEIKYSKDIQPLRKEEL